MVLMRCAHLPAAITSPQTAAALTFFVAGHRHLGGGGSSVGLKRRASIRRVEQQTAGASQGSFWSACHLIAFDFLAGQEVGVPKGGNALCGVPVRVASRGGRAYA
jgi:hypothetical protein